MMRNSLKFSLNNGASLAVIAASLLLVGVPASAQQAPVETVMVTGFRASLESALATKRDASQVMDAISAEDIGKFPDKDMGEALQRVTGVQINRSSGGEGSTVTIRGADPTMTRVEVNGTGALSLTVGSGDRSVDFRDLPVEFVQRLEVIKSPTADMIEGGVGGTIRVITRRPFDSTESYIAGSAQAVNSNLAQTTDPKLALIASKLFFHDTLGVLISGTYEQAHEYDGQALTTGWLRQNVTNAPPASGAAPFNNGQGAPANASGSDFNGDGIFDWYPQIPRYFNNRRTTLRKGLNSVIEYRPTEDFKFFWDVTYAVAHENDNNQALQLNDAGGIFNYAHTTLGADNTVNHIVETSNGGTAPASGCSTGSFSVTPPTYVSHNDHANCLPLDLTFRNILGYLTRTQIQTAVGGSYNLTSELTVDARLDFARAKVDNEETDSTGTQYGTPSSVVDYTGSQHAPNIQLPGTDLTAGSGINELQAYYVPVTNTSREIAEQANLKYKPEWASWLTLKAGLFRHDYTVVETSWGKGTELTCRGAVSAGNKTIVAVPCSVIQGIEASTATTNKIPFYNTGNLGFSDEVRTWLNQTQATILATIAAATAAGMPNANIYNLTTINPVANTNMSYETYTANWSVGEGTTDWYGQADFDFPDFYLPVSGNVGLREVDTHTTTTGYTSVTNTSFAPQANPASCPAPCTTYPVATLKGHYTQSLPSANLKVEILPDELIARLAYGKVMARPAPSQIDIGRTTDIVGLTGKQGNPSLLPFLSTDYDASLEWYISKLNYISVGFFQKNISRFILNTTQPLTIDNVTYSMTFPTNSTVPVKITGIEVGVQYAFDWLPKPFDGFGFTANMTSQKDKGFNQLSLIDGTHLPFPGLSRTAENASVYYENDDFTTRLSYVWRSKWLINASGRGNLPEYNASYGELDASGSYNINENLSVFVDAINLLDAQLVQYNAPARPIQFDTFGTRLFFGVRAKY